MTTVYDVARVAGVSTATVSRVMRESSLVQPETRQRVQAVIEALGFVPDATAQGLSRRRKDIIGLVALERGAGEIDIERESLLFVDQVVHAAEAVLRDTEYSLLLTFGCQGPAVRAARPGPFRQGRRPARRRGGPEHAGPAPPGGADTGRGHRGTADETELDVVLADNVGGITALVSHLSGRHRYRRLCFVTGPPDAPDARERQAAFEDAVLASRGCVIDQVVHGDFSEASGTEAARVLLTRRSLPQAVVCANDQMAIGVLREFQREGIAVPADVALTGFDDVYPSRLVDPPLTTVSQPLRELGVRATRRLLARIEDRALPPQTSVLPTRVVIRASCGCVPPAATAGRASRAGPSGGGHHHKRERGHTG